MTAVIIKNGGIQPVAINSGNKILPNIEPKRPIINNSETIKLLQTSTLLSSKNLSINEELISLP